MRPETDFVLEKAAWPALLLEENGTICRANQAARDDFGLTTRDGRTLASILGNGSAADVEKVLAQQAATGTGRLTLRTLGSKEETFTTHVSRVAREGFNYFILQLFKDSPGN